MQQTSDVRKLFSEKNLIIGEKNTLKALRAGKLIKIFVSNDCAPSMKSRIERYASLSQVEVSTLVQSAEQVGVLCKKPFSIAVLGLEK